MLIKLFVHNYALIQDLDLEFSEGLTIITGETGSGKSILLGALSLILGTRADTSMLLEKDEKCIVEGTFNIGEYDLQEFFLSNELDYDPTAILRREITPSGKSRAFINDTPVTVNLLKELGDMLIDIHSQHQTLMLGDSSFQLDVIDSFAGTGKLRGEFRENWKNRKIMLKQYSTAKEASERNKADMEYYQFQLGKLEEAGLKKGEQEELEAEQELLGHAEEIKLALSKSSELFSADGMTILSMLREVRANLTRIRNFIPDGEMLLSRTESALIELDDLAYELDKLASSVEADPVRLAEVSDRLDYLWSLVQKFHVKDANELMSKKEEIGRLVNSIVSGDELLSELEKAIERENVRLQAMAAEMSAMRSGVLQEIEERITGILKQLGMPNARFRISLRQTPEFLSTGIDQADFLFSANKQVAPENLAKIASGGELSRVMLSLKSVLSKNSNLPTIIFDEIDSGVSGEVADKVGQILSGMGNFMQVINITHLPQVASRGTRHYHVYKDETGSSTITRVKLLSHEERVLEVARMLSGSEVTETAIRNARELLRSVVN